MMPFFQLLYAISWPFAVIHDKLTDLLDYDEDRIIFNRKFICCEILMFLMLFFYFRAYAGIWRFLLVLYLTYQLSIWIWLLSVKLLTFLQILFRPGKSFHSWCEEKLYECRRKREARKNRKTHQRVYGGGSSEVGLRYFIEEEKRANFKPYDAHYYK